MEKLLVADRISKSFGPTRALAEVNFELSPGEVVSVLGENGAGKSTLIKVLSGVVTPDSGTLMVNGRPARFSRPRDSIAAGIAYIPQELAVVGSLTVAENLVLGSWPSRLGLTSSRAITRRASEICERAKIDLPLRRQASTLRLGDLQEIEITRALARDARIILLDEPTAALSEAESSHLFSLIRSLTGRGVGVIFVSHRLEEVAGISDRVCVLRNGRTVAAVDGRSASHADLVRFMIGDAPAIEREQGAKATRRQGTGAGIPVLSLRGLGLPGQAGLRDVSLDVYPGEVVGVYGIRGSGAAALAECLGGELGQAAGRLLVDGRDVAFPRSPRAAARIGIAYVPPDRKRGGLFPNLSVGANLGMTHLRADSAGGFLVASRERARAESVLREFKVAARSERQNVMTLSGGNQQKVLVGGRIASARRLLVAQEPTRGVDIGARREIHRHLRDLAGRGSAALLVTSDVEEAVDISDRVLVIRNGRLVAEITGDQLSQDRVVAAAAGEQDAGAAA
ncbi:MAG: sugar ABC transporter ATP-binding protein [Trebonia sp.]